MNVWCVFGSIHIRLCPGVFYESSILFYCKPVRITMLFLVIKNSIIVVGVFSGNVLLCSAFMCVLLCFRCK